MHQNYKHTKTIESALNISADNIFSVVVFVGDSTFKTNMPKNVTYAGGFISFIKSKTEKILSEKELDTVISKIESGRLSKSIKTHIQHVQHVKNIVKEKARACPKCGSELILRIAKQGFNKGNQFYGCSSYPKCRHTTQVS